MNVYRILGVERALHRLAASYRCSEIDFVVLENELATTEKENEFTYIEICGCLETLQSQGRIKEYEKGIIHL